MKGLLLSVLLFMASTAAAQDTYSWDGSSISLELQGEGAVLTFVNELSMKPSWSDTYGGYVQDGWMTVMFEITGGDGRLPDTLRVFPPPGYAAFPAEVVVEDGSVQVVQIMPILMG